MGYDVHITRVRDWTQSEVDPITQGDWRTYVAGDPELEPREVAEASTPGGGVRYESEGLAVWNAHPTGVEVWFDWRRGAVVVKNPDESTLAKMLAIARLLRAHVVGDEGEVYDAPGKPPKTPVVPLGERIVSWFQRLRSAAPVESAVLPFRVGDRVSDALGNEGTVLEIDLRANHGLGTIRVRFQDGRGLNFAAHAHGLTPLAKRKE